MMRVAVLMGGISSEREVSLISGKQVLANLPKKFQGKAYDPAKDLERLARDFRARRMRVVFNALHGGDGENGRLQAWLELHGIPYTGSGVLASALAMDKAMAKRIFRDAGIPVPSGMLVTRRVWKNATSAVLKRMRKLGASIVIKPNASGSSVGVFVRPKISTWKSCVNASMREDGESVLVETFSPGREFSVGVLEHGPEPEALPVIEIRPKNAFFDYEAKYQGASEELCPAPITPNMERRLRMLAVRAHEALGCRGYSRTDMIWGRRGPVVLETNTLPGLTKASLLPQEAVAAGISFSKLLGILIDSALHV